MFLQVLVGSTLCKLCKVHLWLNLSDVQKRQDELRKFELRSDDMNIAGKT